MGFFSNDTTIHETRSNALTDSGNFTVNAALNADGVGATTLNFGNAGQDGVTAAQAALGLGGLFALVGGVWLLSKG